MPIGEGKKYSKNKQLKFEGEFLNNDKYIKGKLYNDNFIIVGTFINWQPIRNGKMYVIGNWSSMEQKYSGNIINKKFKVKILSKSGKHLKECEYIYIWD